MRKEPSHELDEKKAKLDSQKETIKLEADKVAAAIKQLQEQSKKTKSKDNGPQPDAETRKQFVTFNPLEIKLLEEHKTYFTANSKIGKLFNIDSPDSPVESAPIENTLFKSVLNLACELKGEQKIDTRHDEKLLNLQSLCYDKDPSKILQKAINLIGSHAESNTEIPINSFLENNRFGPINQANSAAWYDLALKSKLALQVLVPYAEKLGSIPKTYDEGLEAVTKIEFPVSKMIEIFDKTKLSKSMTKEKLMDFCKQCTEINSTQKVGDKISEKTLTDGLNILVSLNLKTQDELPDIMVDGASLGTQFEKYYMTKLPPGDPRGLILGKLTNCCQTLGEQGGDAAKHGTTEPNSGFFVICEKGPDGKMNIDKDRIIAQSFAWIGEPTAQRGKTLVLDSWERLGKDNDKLLVPFYSELAKESTYYGVSRVTIGTGGNTPDSLVFFDADEKRIVSFKNNDHPYPADSAFQAIILDKESNIFPSDYSIEVMKRIMDPNVSEESLIKLFERQSPDFFAIDKISNARPHLLKIVVASNRPLLLKSVLEGNCKDVQRDEALLYAAKMKYNIDTFSLLLNDPVYSNVNASDKNGNTALSYASDTDNIELVKFLLEQGANEESRGKALSKISLTEPTVAKREIVKLLFDAGIDDRSIDNVLSRSIAGHKVKFVELILQNIVIDDDKKLRLINFAFNQQEHQVVGAIIKSGVSNPKIFDQCFDMMMYDPKGFITQDLNGNIRIDPIPLDKKDRVKLLCDELLRKGDEAKTILASLRPKTQTELLKISSAEGYTEIVKILSDPGLKIRDVIKGEALIFAISNGHIDEAKLLIKNGAYINAQNEKGETPLMVAISNTSKDKDSELLSLLINSGANPNIKNQNQQTLLDYADDKWKPIIIEYQERFTAKENSVAKKLEGRVSSLLKGVIDDKDLAKLTKYLNPKKVLEQKETNPDTTKFADKVMKSVTGDKSYQKIIAKKVVKEQNSRGI